MDSHAHATPDNPGVDHEKTDVNVRAFFWFGIWFIVFAIVVHIGLYFLYKGFSKLEAKKNGAPMTLVKTSPPHPAGPKLQNDPPAELRKLHVEEDVILNNYGWVDQKAGVVRIPIQRAMELTVQRGLPVVTEAPVSAQTPPSTTAAPVPAVTAPAATPAGVQP
jgi:hypothetical protein